MNNGMVSQAVSGAKLRHQRRLMSALAVLRSTIDVNALQSVLGPAHLVIHEAGVLGLDDNAVYALINNCDLQISDVINCTPLPIAAE